MSITPVSNTGYFFNVGNSILDSLVNALNCNGLDVPDRRFVGFEEPPQDCCPDLVLWISNIRPWDGDFPDTRNNGRLLCTNAYAFDVTVRIGRCYLDYLEDGAMPEQDIEDQSKIMYADATALYMGWVAQWRSGNVTELNNYEAVTVGTLTSYTEGACGGWQFTITVSTI